MKYILFTVHPGTGWIQRHDQPGWLFNFNQAETDQGKVLI